MIVRAFLLILAMASICGAGTTDPSVSDSKYVEYGEKHKCVVPIYGDYPGKSGGGVVKFAASAVVVGPRWILTAAHIVKDASNVRVRVGEKDHKVKKIVVNGKFDEEKVGMYDIAMCMSDEDMILDFYPDLYDGDDEEGKVSSICGYGSYGTLLSGAKKYDGKKRAGSNVVERVENHVLVCSAEKEGRTSMEFLIAHGDSGGGLFIDQKLAGVNSFVMATDGNPESDYGDECCHTRVSIFVPWIRGHMNGENPEDDVK